jgi:hypothetical protein
MSQTGTYTGMDFAYAAGKKWEFMDFFSKLSNIPWGAAFLFLLFNYVITTQFVL